MSIAVAQPTREGLISALRASTVSTSPSPATPRASSASSRPPATRPTSRRSTTSAKASVPGAVTRSPPGSGALSVPEYLQKADVWPLNPEGEIMLGDKLEAQHALGRDAETLSVPGLALAENGSRALGLSYGSTWKAGRPAVAASDTGTGAAERAGWAGGFQVPANLTSARRPRLKRTQQGPQLSEVSRSEISGSASPAMHASILTQPPGLNAAWYTTLERDLVTVELASHVAPRRVVPQFECNRTPASSWAAPA